MRAVGRGLLVTAVLIVLFVAYQLWGTGLAQSRAQQGLRRQFEQAVAARRAAVGSGARTSMPVAVPPVGRPVGVLRIPKLDVDQVVVEGVGATQLSVGPGHYPGTPLPGQPGNAAIAGHRTTYGRPFYDLNDLVRGNLITVTTVQGTFRYAVVGSEVVAPSDGSVLDPSRGPELTLTTCTPRYSAARRLVVVARLLSPVAIAGSVPGPVPVRAALDPDPLRDVGDWLRLALWTVVGLGVVLVAGRARRRLDRRAWVVPVAAVPVAGVVLFLLFGAINTLLPQSF